MNLLSDIRDNRSDQTTAEVKPDFAVKNESPLIKSEMTLSDSIRTQDNLYNYKRSRRSLKPFLVILFILLLTSVSLYWFMLRKHPIDIKKISENAAPVDTTLTNETNDFAGKETIAAPENFQNTENAISNEPAKKPAALKGLNVLAATLSLFTNSLPPDITIGTLYMDESTFTVDITSSENVGSFYSMLTGKCPSSVTFSPLHPAGVNERTLITGTINLTDQDFIQRTASSNGNIENDIQSISTDVGVQIINLNIGQSRSFDNFKSTEIFIKVDGSFLQCQAFFEGIAQKRWNLRVSKILFIPTTGHNANLVLRLQKIEPLTS
jgi:hypothetical protein